MGKKRGGVGVGFGINKKPPPTSGLLQHGKSQPASLRQQQSGRGGAAVSSQSLNPSEQANALRADHLLRIATWASASVPPLGALFGARLGCLCEAAGVPVPDTPHSICQRCESILQVGVNCSVRITKDKRKGKSGNTGNVSNYVTYVCHFCKHGNAKPGTSKKHLKTKIAQAAARANLNLLGKSSFAEAQSVDKPTLPLNARKENQQGPAEEEASVQICLEGPEAVETTLDKGPLDVAFEGCSEQEGSKVLGLFLEKRLSDLMETSEQGLSGQEGPEPVEMTLEKGPLYFLENVIAGQEGAKTVEMTFDMESLDANQPGWAEQESAQAVEVILDKELLDVTEKNQPEQESAKAVAVVLDKELLDVTEKNQPEQESAKAVAVVLDKELLDVTEKNQPEQESAKAVAVILDKGPLDLNQQGFTQQEGSKTVEVKDQTGKNAQGFAEQEGVKSTGTGLNRLPLDISSKKKRKKKNQQGVVEQEGPKTSAPKGLVVESNDSSKRKKRKGWSNLKELVSLP